VLVRDSRIIEIAKAPFGHVNAEIIGATGTQHFCIQGWSGVAKWGRAQAVRFRLGVYFSTRTTNEHEHEQLD
jgi:hypothetical protein